MTLGPTFDTALAAARTGAEWAWECIYRELSPRLLRYLKARGAEDPENVMGEVFVQVVRKLSQFEGGESEFTAWLFTIARNRLVDEGRRRGRRPTESPFCVSPEQPSLGGADARREFPGVSQTVRDLLGQLTPEQRDVLFLRVLAGLSLDETAQVLGKTVGSVKRLQARGLKSLRQKVAAGVVSF